MTEHKALARLRAVIQNQADAGENDVRIPLSDALGILGEINDEEEELDERATQEHEEAVECRRLYSELKADLGMTEENPEHYRGDGIVSCSRAMRSMLTGWEVLDGELVPLACAYWTVSAFKYLWRFPLKDNPKRDLRKAVDCANRALKAWEE